MKSARFASPFRSATLGLLTALVGACGKAPPAPAPTPIARYAELQQAPSARFVKLEEVSEWTGQAWATIAEFNVVDANGADIDRSKWTVSADSSGANDYPTNAIDGDPKTLWHTRWEGTELAPPPPHWFAVSLGSPARISGFRYLPRQDGNANGTIAKYRFYVSNDGVNWGEPVAAGDFATGGVSNTEKLVVFAKQTPNHAPVATTPPAETSSLGQVVSLQVKASDEDGDPLNYEARGLPPGLSIDAATGLVTGTPITVGDFQASVSVSDRKAAPTTVAFPWSVRVAPLAGTAPALGAGEVRFVKLEALTEINGKPWSSVAEFNLMGADGADLPHTGWVVSADSTAASDQAANAIDGNPRTLWHSQWDGASPPPPHTLVIDMGRGNRVSGFRYLPRQDTSMNGMIGKFRFYVSVDGVDWGQPVAEGDFGASRSEKTILVR